MPESKRRRRGAAGVRRRRKVADTRAHQTQAAQQQAERRKLTPAAYMRRRALAYGLFGLAVLIAASHVVEHGGYLRLLSPGLEDLLIGYPTAALLAIVGAVILPR
jgi:hypothetical protein